MLIQSTEYPSKFFKHQGRIFINDIANVEQITQNFDGVENVIYSYEHYPLEISDRVDLAQYVESNYNLLLNKAKNDFDTKFINDALAPSQEDVDKANRDIETINLLIELGVLQ